MFYGVSEEIKGLQLGTPIPGYSGTMRRIEADNVFGMTYAEACKRANDSLNRIKTEKGETLKLTSTFVASYKQPGGGHWAREWQNGAKKQ